MRFIWGALLLAGVCASCVTTSASRNAGFVASPSAIDVRLDVASVEDYIIALPPHAFHEESVEQFQERVIKARKGERRNQGANPDTLYVAGDGSWPAKTFRLDRKTHTLHIRVDSGESDSPPYETTMRRVAGGWVSGPTINLPIGT